MLELSPSEAAFHEIETLLADLQPEDINEVVTGLVCSHLTSLKDTARERFTASLIFAIISDSKRTDTDEVNKLIQKLCAERNLELHH
jgi:hypothetical protein